MQQSQEEIKKWLEQHKEQVLKITKVENGDLDLAAIKLKGVSFVQHRHTDDYLSTQALLLRGEGTVSTPHGRESLLAQPSKSPSQTTGTEGGWEQPASQDRTSQLHH